MMLELGSAEQMSEHVERRKREASERFGVEAEHRAMFYRECVEGREDLSPEDRAAVLRAMEARPTGVWASYDGETVRFKGVFRFRDQLVMEFDISRHPAAMETYILGNEISEYVPLPFEKKVRKSSRPKK